ncbi:Flp pilus assembly protein TadB [Deinobacterium chartae]|uniref:Flp pilus assembly protein TadB n=1 Tax=Deinobacterium chartae TaxID=521158 RepID=A0A841HV55_9DEIO|nr:hypothetical protein [Deinobacterium chartae]MBB6096713.1 Flp pilus assembly protein TadB [Deinobacterium chartae]
MRTHRLLMWTGIILLSFIIVYSLMNLSVFPGWLVAANVALAAALIAALVLLSRRSRRR